MWRKRKVSGAEVELRRHGFGAGGREVSVVVERSVCGGQRGRADGDRLNGGGWEGGTLDQRSTETSPGPSGHCFMA